MFPFVFVFANALIESILPKSQAGNGSITLGGSRLNLHEEGDFDSSARIEPGANDGFLVAIPQVPAFMSAHYPDVFDASKSGGPGMEEYSAEWFERLIYIDMETANQIVAGKKFEDQQELVGVMAGDLALRPEYSRGCARVAPIVEVYKYRIGRGTEKLKGQYHALIDAFGDEEKKTVTSMRIVPVGMNVGASLKSFVNSKRHAELKDQHEDGTGTAAAALQARMLQAIVESAST